MVSFRTDAVGSCSDTANRKAKVARQPTVVKWGERATVSRSPTFSWRLVLTREKSGGNRGSWVYISSVWVFHNGKLYCMEGNKGFEWLAFK
jgi:hypothetical protein